VAHLSAFVPLFRGMGKDARRTGIPGTLHRISRIVHAVGNPDGLGMIGLVARIGRTLQGHVAPMLGGEGGCDVRRLVRLVSLGGLLIIGPPNVGKTTVLRELARLLASDDGTIVCIVDKTLEICGTDSVPVERAIGNARVLTVGQDRRGGQAAVMIEAIENQSPDVVVVDELSTREECQAARTIVGRGAAVVASVHGESLAQVVRDPERNIITGSITSVTLSAGEAKERADKLRQVERRMGAPVFRAAVELRGFGEWVLHEDIEHTVDALLDGRPCRASRRTRTSGAGGEAVTSEPLIGVHQRPDGFAYVKPAPGAGHIFSFGGANGGANSGASGGASGGSAGKLDFHQKNEQGQLVWRELSSVTPLIYQRAESDC